MRKLICIKDVEAFEKQGQKIVYIESNTIITPAARDAAKVSGIEFSYEKKPVKAFHLSMRKPALVKLTVI